ncbi:MAG: alpha/beta fold hydrolase [Microthrixaceae bacterium]
MSHGWAPGLRPAVESSEGFIRVWDEEATTADGARFDRWYAPLADAILDYDPTSTVLGYTWIDKSATTSSRLRGARSQLRTNSAGHELAIALREALGDQRPKVHLIGHSHGAKVVTVAATLLPEAPAQLTLFDSPDNLLPIAGGALNDLSSYLRALPIGSGEGKTFVDNYPSRYGIRYGRDPGLSKVVDVALDPTRFPIDETVNEHSYAWLWYTASARDVSRGVGFAWSPLNAAPAKPSSHELQQQASDPSGDPLVLEPAQQSRRGRTITESIRERTPKAVSGTLTSDQPVQRGLSWRRRGDQLAALNIRWLEGPPDTTLTLRINRAELWKSERGWSADDTRHGVAPIAGVRAGVSFYEVRLDATEPAAVEITPGTIRTVPLSLLDEYRSWLRLVAVGILMTALLAIAELLRRSPRRGTRRSHRVRRRSRHNGGGVR